MTRTELRQGRAQREVAAVGEELLRVAPGCAFTVEVSDLPKKRTGDGQFDRDRGLEELHRDIHGA
jgi:hypothetical protein